MSGVKYYTFACTNRYKHFGCVQIRLNSMTFLCVNRRISAPKEAHIINNYTIIHSYISVLLSNRNHVKFVHFLGWITVFYKN